MQLIDQTLPRENVISRLDVRVKLGLLFSFLIMVLSYRGFLLPALLLFLSFLLCLSWRVKVRTLLVLLAEPLFLAAVIVILKFFFSGSQALFTCTIGGFSLIGYTDGLRDGLLIAVRIMAATALVATLTLCASFTELMAGLYWFRVPRALIEILIFTYRYLFVLREEAQIIYQSQKNRLGYAGIKRGLNSFGILAGSLLIRAFDQSQAVTVSMMQRGYDGRIPLRKPQPLRPGEVLVFLLVVGAAGLVWRL